MRLTFAKGSNALVLYKEIIAAIPSLSPVTVSGSPFPAAQVLIEGDATHTIITVPDSASSAAIAAVMAKHNPAPSPVLPSAKDTAIAALNAALTINDLKAALVAYLSAG